LSLVVALALAPGGCGVDTRPPAADSSADSSDVTDLSAISDPAAAKDSAGPPSPPARARASWERDDPRNSPREAAGADATGPLRFTEVASGSGIDFVHTSGMTGEKFVPTANGSGVAIFDYDNDGQLDLYFANGTFLPVGSKPTGPNRLYKNLGEGKFR